jgi:hypothetical protein
MFLASDESDRLIHFSQPSTCGLKKRAHRFHFTTLQVRTRRGTSLTLRYRDAARVQGGPTALTVPPWTIARAGRHKVVGLQHPCAGTGDPIHCVPGTSVVAWDHSLAQFAQPKVVDSIPEHFLYNEYYPHPPAGIPPFVSRKPAARRPSAPRGRRPETGCETANGTLPLAVVALD